MSLFTNVSVELAILSIENRWSYIQKHTNIPKKQFLCMVQFILDSKYFNFDHRIFKQTFGTTIDSFLSPIIVDIVLQNLKNRALFKTNM